MRRPHAVVRVAGSLTAVSRARAPGRPGPGERGGAPAAGADSCVRPGDSACTSETISVPSRSSSWSTDARGQPAHRLRAVLTRRSAGETSRPRASCPAAGGDPRRADPTAVPVLKRHVQY
ncbi:hypothetical protein HBB16_03355 [Pseudonocardia sp. MCCB 268]|nr:hypothetical protein [Pseudonocardia cytotoxica]